MMGHPFNMFRESKRFPRQSIFLQLIKIYSLANFIQFAAGHPFDVACSNTMQACGHKSQGRATVLGSGTIRLTRNTVALSCRSALTPGETLGIQTGNLPGCGVEGLKKCFYRLTFVLSFRRVGNSHRSNSEWTERLELDVRSYPIAI
jgi:hypothetical protein